MTTLIPIHSAAMFHVVHVRSRMVVGARSLFHKGLADTSSRSSTKSRRSPRPSSSRMTSLSVTRPKSGALSVQCEFDRDRRADGDEAGGEGRALVGVVAAADDGAEVVRSGVAAPALFLDGDGLADGLADLAGHRLGFLFGGADGLRARLIFVHANLRGAELDILD